MSQTISRCRVCDTQTSQIDTNSVTVQKHIQNQARAYSSVYTMNIAAMNNSINNTNVGIKHGSYERYLLKKKGQVLSNVSRKVASLPIKGNKTNATSLSSMMTQCINQNC